MLNTIQLIKFLDTQGVGGQTNERLFNYLEERTTQGSIDDRFFRFLVNEGYTGSYNGMQIQFLNDVISGTTVPPDVLAEITNITTTPGKLIVDFEGNLEISTEPGKLILTAVEST